MTRNQSQFETPQQIGQTAQQPTAQGSSTGGMQGSSQMGHQGSTQMGQRGGQQGSSQVGQQGGQRMGQQGELQMGQQGGQQASQVAGGQTGQGMALQDVESPQQREALRSILRAVKTCAWCADQCIQEASPHMVECIRQCEDVTELGETAIALIPRQSRYTQTVVQTLQQAAQDCAQECSQHSHAHCQECAQVLEETVRALQEFTSSQQAAQGTQQMGTQPTSIQ